ncbi:hypothetical protein L1987_65584 [Smallanthus sonchifolius]|uniref:Uncharacterized protein n=1 Tax=Smallanthus sonchifolius TaxID=185202 RepID=A0ACB9BUQ7_9ASTR|nr:hypothetical protein L1987_65584 [Smallanthus sonchifolius]
MVFPWLYSQFAKQSVQHAEEHCAQMIFFILNIIEGLGVLLTFKPFLLDTIMYRVLHAWAWGYMGHSMDGLSRHHPFARKIQTLRFTKPGLSIAICQ